MFVHDPVCGKKINRNKAHITIEYGGHEYLLCCPMCQAEFERHPAKYATANQTRKEGSRNRAH